MRVIDGEPIRRFPVWFARLLNGVIGWTDRYCAAGCGYPVTTQWHYTVEQIDGVPVAYALCSRGGSCEGFVRNAVTQQSYEHRYADIRPDIVRAIQINPDMQDFWVARTR